MSDPTVTPTLRCPESQRPDGDHDWRFWGDYPYVKCFYCGEIRDALTGRVIPL